MHCWYNKTFFKHNLHTYILISSTTAAEVGIMQGIGYHAIQGLHKFVGFDTLIYTGNIETKTTLST